MGTTRRRKPETVGPRIDREKDASPCAGKCRHKWCSGYNAGYWDGKDNAEAKR